MRRNVFPMFVLLKKKHIQWGKCKNISVASKQYSLNNRSQKDIRKVIETINNREKGEYIGIFTTVSLTPSFLHCTSSLNCTLCRSTNISKMRNPQSMSSSRVTQCAWAGCGIHITWGYVCSRGSGKTSFSLPCLPPTHHPSRSVTATSGEIQCQQCRAPCRYWQV